MPTLKKKCKICSKLLHGRNDKIFCSIRCKNYYHVNLRKATQKATLKIDRILHRNRSILLELLGKTKTNLTLPRLALEQKRFNFNYHTHSTTNLQGKTYFWVYDFAWMPFSDNKVLIIRKSFTKNNT
jgi:hypothetical protein